MENNYLDDFNNFLHNITAEEELIKNASKKIMPYGYYYEVEGKYLEPSDLVRASKDYSTHAQLGMKMNSENFLKHLNNLKKDDLAEEFEVQLHCYRNKLKDLSDKDKKNELCRWCTHSEEIINRTGSNSYFNEGNKYVKYIFDKWLKSKLDIINEKENQSNSKITETNVEAFRIPGKLEFPGVKKYFMQLNSIHSDYPNSKSEIICVLTETQIKELLKSNTKKYSTPNFSQTQIRIFIYHFKKLHKSSENKVLDFVNFELESFDAFDGLLSENEYTNFNKGNVKLSPPYDSFNFS